MPVLFSAVCELLEQSYNLSLAKKPVTQTVIAWFEKHRQVIDARNTDVAALLSTLLPEKRTDRVFCIKTPSLEKLIGRALFLGRSRIHELASYQRPEAKCDLADCVERILRATVSNFSSFGKVGQSLTCMTAAKPARARQCDRRRNRRGSPWIGGEDQMELAINSSRQHCDNSARP